MLTLETERLLIRPIAPQDLDALYRLLDVESADTEIETDGLASKQARTRWVEWTVLGYEQQDYLHQPPYGERAVVSKATNELIGAVGFVPCLAPFSQLPSFGGEQFPARFTPEFGMYWAISSLYQRKGIATEAARKMVQYAFDMLNVKRVVATTTYTNTASIRVMQKLGMHIERNSYDEPVWFQVVGVLEQARAR